MIDISKPQYKMLCKIKKEKSIPHDKLSDEEKEICQYLLQHNCIRSRSSSVPNINGGMRLMKSMPSNITLSQTGEAQIYIFRSQIYKWWIPVIISIISVALSATSIISQVVQLLGKLLQIS